MYEVSFDARRAKWVSKSMGHKSCIEGNVYVYFC